MRVPALQNHRFEVLDYLRGIMAFTIIIWHYRHFYLYDPGMVLPSASVFPWYAYLQPLYEGKIRAVEIFWVLSGFVFCAAYNGKCVSLYEFTVNRISRLYPLHLVTLLFLAAIAWFGAQHWPSGIIYFHDDLYHFVLQLFFASYWGFEKGNSFNGPIWSVSLEFVIYFVFLFILRASRGVLALPVVVAAMAGSLLAFAMCPDPIQRFALCGAYFFVGVSVCVARGTPRHTVILCILSAVSVGVAVMWAWPADTKKVLWLLTGALLTALLSHPRVEAYITRLCDTLRIRHAMKRLGDMSYGIYLVHVPVQTAMIAASKLGWISIASLRGEWYFLLAYIVLVLMLANWAYLAIERPLQKYIRSKTLHRATVS